MTTTEQLERETELCRQQLLGTMDELRARMTPRQMVNNAIDYVSDGDGAEFARNLKTQIVANPLPTTLLGAGLAWLMLASKAKPGSAHSSGSARRAMHDVRDGIGDIAGTMSQAGRDAADSSRSAMAGIKDAMTSTAGAAGDAYESFTDRAARSASAAADAARNVGQSARATGGSMADFFRDQPLVVAGLGLAIGAALGAMLPSTDVEDDVMGRTADDLKEEAREAATQTYEKASAVASSAADAAADEAARQGLTEQAASGTRDDFGARDDSGTRDDRATLVPEHPEEHAVGTGEKPKPASAPLLD